MPRVVIVLGMHRSGTSCLAGILENAGVNFGEVSKHNVFNPKGNRENRLIMDLHDSLLTYNLGSWDSPPLDISWPLHLKTTRDEIIGGFRESVVWGFKDPRTLLALDGWMEALDDVRLIATFRHPMSVALSLKERNNFPVEKSLDLWRAYNDRLLSYSEKYDLPMISFDLPAGIYREKITLLINRIGLPTTEDPSVFFEEDLRKHLPEPEVIPPAISRIYEQLKRKSI